MGAHLVSLSFVFNLKSSIRFELDFKMADLQATECGRCLLLIGQSATGDSIGSLCFLPCVLIIPSMLPSFFFIPSIHLTRVTVNDTFDVVLNMTVFRIYIFVCFFVASF